MAEVTFPSDWASDYLSSVCEIVMGQSPLSSSYNKDGLGLPLVQGMADIDDRKSISRIWTDTPAKIVPEGTTLVSVRAPVGEVSKASEKVCLGRGMGGLTPNHFIAKEYLYQYMIFEKTYWSAIQQGSTFTAVNKNDMSNFLVFYPKDIEEQKAIAEALSDIDELIEKTDQEQRKLTQLFSTVSEKYLDHNNFLDSSKNYVLGDLGKVLRGVTFNAEADFRPFGSQNSIELLRSNNVQDNKLFLENTYNVSLEKVNAFQILKNGDSLICMANGSKDLVGKSAYVDDSIDGKFTFGSFMGSYRPNDPMNGKYISYILKSFAFRNHINLILAGSSINNLTPALIEEFKFDLPDPEELKKIVEILSDIEKLIQETRIVKFKFECIKQGMAHDLLTGKVRMI